MSKKVNEKDTTAGRMRQAVFEWIGDVADLDERLKRRLADDLAKMIGNQLFVAAQAKEDLLRLSMELEGKEAETPPPRNPEPPMEQAPKWGPQWKD